jgi:transposase
MNSNRYINVLENELIPSIHLWFSDVKDCIFQQDNAPCHASQLTRAFFQDNDITVLEWPPFSPDLNPIENLWAILKRKLHEKSFTSKEDVIAEVHRLWCSDNLLNSHCANLANSMPERVRQCVRFRGAATGY